jgi:DNA-binding XRE family transcriptional regulator
MTELPNKILGAALARSKLGPANVAGRANVPLRIAANAICGRPVATNSYLRICRAIDFDPAPSLKMQNACGPDFDFSYLAMALKITRGLNKHSDREAAKAIGVGASTICRAERGEATQIGVVLSICAYLKVHPFGYMR